MILSPLPDAAGLLLALRPVTIDVKVFMNHVKVYIDGKVYSLARKLWRLSCLLLEA